MADSLPFMSPWRFPVRTAITILIIKSNVPPELLLKEI